MAEPEWVHCERPKHSWNNYLQAAFGLTTGIFRRAGKAIVDKYSLYEFQKLTTARLKQLFELDCEALPKEIVDRLKRLRQAEQKLLNRKPRAPLR